MAEKLPDVVLSERDETEKLRRCVTEMKLKMMDDRERCKELSDTGCHFEEKEDETL